MEKYAFKMKLNPGFSEEYKKRHDEIWPELVTILKEVSLKVNNLIDINKLIV